jgi:hypothetical protein
MASYKHIFISGNVSREKYRAPSQMGGIPRIPIRDRGTHSQKLLSQFDTIWQAKEQLKQQRDAEQIATRKGTYISFTSAADHDLITESLESTRGKKTEKWIRLLNVRSVTLESGQKLTQAVVYIPNGKEGYFIKKLRDYQSENFRNTENPKNAKLVTHVTHYFSSYAALGVDKLSNSLCAAFKAAW